MNSHVSVFADCANMEFDLTMNVSSLRLLALKDLEQTELYENKHTVQSVQRYNPQLFFDKVFR